MLWNAESLARKFSAMGAELTISTLARPAKRGVAYTMDVQPIRGTQRERFILSVVEPTAVEAEVLHVREAERHLLLLVKTPTARGPEKHRYLCGHDERHWFVASVPGVGRTATTVAQAMDALQPEAVRDALRSGQVRHKDRHVRHNPAFVRQGEWFFVPAPSAVIDPSLIHRNEPLRRGGKPHWVQELVRWGGEARYVSRRHQQALTLQAYEALMIRQPEARSWGWSIMRANPKVFARGRVWHADHATVHLQGWHRVLVNEENRASWREQVLFLD